MISKSHIAKSLLALGTLGAFSVSAAVSQQTPPAAPPAAQAAPAAPPAGPRRPGGGPGTQRGGRPGPQQRGRGGYQRSGGKMQHRRPGGGFQAMGHGGPMGGGMGRSGGMMGGGFHIAPAGMWWKNPSVVSKLTLTADQQKKMDDIFQASRIKLVDLKANVEKQELMLEPMLSANPPDLEKENAGMLLGIRILLTPDQWTKLHSAPEAAATPGPGGPGQGGPGGPGGGRGRGFGRPGGGGPGGQDFAAPDLIE